MHSGTVTTAPKDNVAKTPRTILLGITLLHSWPHQVRNMSKDIVHRLYAHRTPVIATGQVFGDTILPGSTTLRAEGPLTVNVALSS